MNWEFLTPVQFFKNSVRLPFARIDTNASLITLNQSAQKLLGIPPKGGHMQVLRTDGDVLYLVKLADKRPANAYHVGFKGRVRDIALSARLAVYAGFDASQKQGRVYIKPKPEVFEGKEAYQLLKS